MGVVNTGISGITKKSVMSKTIKIGRPGNFFFLN
jgi:hypothetical protein